MILGSRTDPTRLTRRLCRCMLGVVVSCAPGAPIAVEDTPPDTISVPVDLGDGWQVAAARDHGLDEAALARFGRRIASGEFGDYHGVVIARSGRLIFEEYYGTGARDGLHEIASVTKSVNSVLMGIAIDLGFVSGDDAPIMPFFPEYAGNVTAEPRLADLQIRHLLTMSVGLDWDEWSSPFSSTSNTAGELYRSDDWVGYFLSRSVVAAPGTTFVYNSGGAVTLGAIVSRASGQDLEHFAHDNLFGPLNIQRWAWERNPRHGEQLPHAGGGLDMLLRDMAKIGWLMVSGGTWNGRRIISSDWLDASSQPSIGVFNGTDYGYQWWIEGGGGPGPRIIQGRGSRGQYLLAVPELDLLMAVIGGRPRDGFWPETLLRNFVLPAITP